MSISSAIRRKIEETFSPMHLELENESHLHASGAHAETHFRLVLVSSSFEGVNRVDRQRRVMDLFGEERSRGLHALTMRVMTPDEWNKLKDSFEMVSPACHGGSKHDKKGK